jgi:predicted Fe-Mo cluster-binding NifX family protein
MISKIAFPTDDGLTISAHFGQAHHYKIFTFEDGKVISAEIREKATHTHGAPTSEGVHPGQKMIDAIQDCQVLISGGMGSPVYERAKLAGLEVILTRSQEIDAALQDYLAGKLVNVPDLIHMH